MIAERAEVGKGINLKRNWPHGRGRSGVRKKYRSHLTVRQPFFLIRLSKHDSMQNATLSFMLHVLMIQDDFAATVCVDVSAEVSANVDTRDLTTI